MDELVSRLGHERIGDLLLADTDIDARPVFLRERAQLFQ
jgi:hypothetical protein